MKKLIALLIGASVISAAAFAEDNQQAAPAKSDAVMQQLAENTSTPTATDATSQDQAAAPAKKAKKHRMAKKQHKKGCKKDAAPAGDTAAPADATAPASN